MRNRTAASIAACLIALAAGGASFADPIGAPAGAPSFNVKDFGAKGDGVTDDYDAIQAAVAAINPPPFGTGTGQGTLLFPPGEYFINRYRIVDSPDANNINNIAFESCNGVSVLGTGAKISVLGKFYRSKWETANNVWYSNIYNVIPLYFDNCQNFLVDGFELNGNVQDTTRDPEVVEGRCYGLATQASSNYIIQNVYAHHFAADGVMLGSESSNSAHPIATADRNATLINVHSANNARDGLAIYHVRGAMIQNSLFETSGDIGGSYGGHYPYAGAGLEPTAFTVGVDVDVKTGDVTFQNCTFRNNMGMQFFVGGGDRTDNITLDGCTFEEGPLSINDYTVLMAVKNGLIQNCTMRGKRMTFVRGSFPGVSVTIRNNTLYSNAFALVGDSLPCQALIEGNTIIGTFTAPTSNYLVFLQNLPQVTFRMNTVIVPKEAKNANSAQGIVTLNNIGLSEQNSLSTDLTTPATSYFCTVYGTTPVYLDRYISGDAIRPECLASFPNQPFYTTIIPGDVNNDHAVTFDDAIAALRIAGGLSAVTMPGGDVAPARNAAGGVGDGVVDIVDVVRILRHVQGYIPVWP
ncbi:MAG TPA: glycosyl hydrolase family 28-related protein [Armatimonadota bacterium]